LARNSIQLRLKISKFRELFLIRDPPLLSSVVFEGGFPLKKTQRFLLAIFFTMLSVVSSILIGSKLGALLLTHLRRLCVSWPFACWNTVRRSKGGSAQVRAAAVRSTAVCLVKDDRFRRRVRVEACVEEGKRWLGGAPRRQHAKS